MAPTSSILIATSSDVTCSESETGFTRKSMPTSWRAICCETTKSLPTVPGTTVLVLTGVLASEAALLTGIGTFVDLQRGHVYPEKVLASEKKPIRIFMVDGRNDNRGINDKGEYDPHRDWFLQNVRLMEALTKKGYDVNYSWGMGVHSHDMGGAMLPEMMRWLWRDQPMSLDPGDTRERSFRSRK